MQQDDVKLDDDGVPLLDTPVDPEAIAVHADTTKNIDPADEEQLEQLLRTESVQQILDDLSADLQQTITLKIESFLKQEISRLIHQAAEESAPKIAADIHTHLQLAIPELLAEITRQSKR